MPGALHPAERRLGRACQHLVDRDHPRLDIALEARALVGILRPHRRAQSERHGIGDTDCLVDIRRLEQHRNRPEQFLVRDFVISRYVDQNAGRHIRALAGKRLAAEQQLRARLLEQLKLAEHGRALLLAR